MNDLDIEMPARANQKEIFKAIINKVSSIYKAVDDLDIHLIVML